MKPPRRATAELRSRIDTSGNVGSASHWGFRSANRAKPHTRLWKKHESNRGSDLEETSGCEPVCAGVRTTGAAGSRATSMRRTDAALLSRVQVLTPDPAGVRETRRNRFRGILEIDAVFHTTLDFSQGGCLHGG